MPVTVPVQPFGPHFTRVPDILDAPQQSISGVVDDDIDFAPVSLDRLFDLLLRLLARHIQLEPLSAQ